MIYRQDFEKGAAKIYSSIKNSRARGQEGTTVRKSRTAALRSRPTAIRGGFSGGFPFCCAKHVKEGVALRNEITSAIHARLYNGSA